MTQNNFSPLAITAFTCFIAGLLCLFIFHLSESYVDKQGVLHEAFAWLGVGYILVFASILLSLIYFFLKRFKK